MHKVRLLNTTFIYLCFSYDTIIGCFSIVWIITLIVWLLDIKAADCYLLFSVSKLHFYAMSLQTQLPLRLLCYDLSHL